MKIFKYDGPGHYIGAHIIVTAKTRSDAEIGIARILRDTGLKHEADAVIGLVEDKRCVITEFSSTKKQVILVLNGDY